VTHCKKIKKNSGTNCTCSRNDLWFVLWLSANEKYGIN
jgi:hypothetical protein